MKHNFLLFGIIVLSLFWSLHANGQNLNHEELNAKIESLVPASVQDTTPGLVIGVVHKGELIFSSGYGLSNLPYNILNDPNMLYNLGSVSKQFLGYAFAILHTEGKLNVDDPVGKHLEDWPEFEQKVTIRNLLTHTSGYREAYTMSTLAGRSIGIDRLTRKECLDVVRKQPELEFTPGSRFSYNSTAWVILAEILEEVTGQSAHDWVTDNILLPIGMKNTTIESYVGQVIPNTAESYYHDQELGYGNSKSNRAIFGAADVYSSVNDLTHWFNNFQTQKTGDRSAAMELFLSPFELNDGAMSDYGFGINNSLHKGVKLYSHTGAHESFYTQLRYYPEHDLGIVAISNFEGKGWLPTNELAEYILEEYMVVPEKMEHQPFDLTSAKAKQLEGTYLSPTLNTTNKLTLVNDTLTIWDGMQMIPISENKFYSKSWGGQFEFVSKKGEPTQLIIHGDSKMTYNKVSPWNPSAKELKAYESNFWSKELETTYHLTVKEDQLTIQHRWLGEIVLKPITQNLFESDSGWFLEFNTSAENEILGFTINSSRTLNIFFEK